MDIAKASDADELWGWPVELLDRLLVLQHRAWAGEVSIEDWRTSDAALRDGQPPVDSEEVGATLTEWVSQGVLDLRTHGDLLSRLTVLANHPPTDDHLWTQLVEAARRAEAEDANPWFVDVDRARRDLIVSWLARPDSEIDAASGLPRTMLAEHGSALDGLSEVEQQCAKLIAARRAEA